MQTSTIFPSCCTEEGLWQNSLSAQHEHYRKYKCCDNLWRLSLTVLGTKTRSKVGEKEAAIGNSYILQDQWWEKNIPEGKAYNARTTLPEQIPYSQPQNLTSL